jgi:hypothetical protein
MKEGSKNVVFRVELKALGVIGINGVASYGVPLASTWIL